MSQTIQPLPSAASTTPRPPQLHAAALVSLWCDLALKVAESNAHRLPDAHSLFEQQMLVEDEIARSHPELDERMTELLVWESELIHDASGEPGSCLQCRRARLHLPPECPVPSTRKGVRR